MYPHDQNVSVEGYLIREKALDFAKELDTTDLKASEGWLNWWKSRNNIVFRTSSGEKKSLTAETTAR